MARHTAHQDKRGGEAKDEKKKKKENQGGRDKTYNKVVGLSNRATLTRLEQWTNISCTKRGGGRKGRGPPVELQVGGKKSEKGEPTHGMGHNS